jgi:NTE family protein
MRGLVYTGKGLTPSFGDLTWVLRVAMTATDESPSPVPSSLAAPVPRSRRERDIELGLCLSGGGYRAMLFHAGALARLNELGYLSRLDAISSVSGGSIAAGLMGAVWDRLEFDAGGVARKI